MLTFDLINFRNLFPKLTEYILRNVIAIICKSVDDVSHAIPASFNKFIYLDWPPDIMTIIDVAPYTSAAKPCTQTRLKRVQVTIPKPLA